MALVILPLAISAAFGTFSFFMGDGPQTVRVDVSKDLLACIETPTSTGRSDCLERLRRHLYLFAHIAACKYDAGQYTREVRLLVVRVEPVDLHLACLIAPAESKHPQPA